MSSEDGCPLCGKPVLGRTALLGHLEYAHDIDAPEPFLEELLRPEVPRRRRGAAAGALARRAAPVLAVVVLACGSFVAYQQLVVDTGTDTAAAQASDAEATSTTAAVPETSTTTVAPTTTAAPVTTTTAAPTTTAPPTTTTTTATTAAPTRAPSSELEFRKPFLVDAAHEGCTTRDGQAVHTISFTFSGSRNITFDGEFHPDRTGDGRHTATHALPAGTRAYLDHVVVVDPAGDGHDVEISPPVYLGAC